VRVLTKRPNAQRHLTGFYADFISAPEVGEAQDEFLPIACPADIVIFFMEILQRLNGKTPCPAEIEGFPVYENLLMFSALS
jgi:hypothetical protein